MLNESCGHSFRGYCIISPKGILKARVCSDLPVGLYAGDILDNLKELVEAEKLGLEDKSVLENRVAGTGGLLPSLRTGASNYESNILQPAKFSIYSAGLVSLGE